MGVWGTGPFDNDEAGDALAAMFRSVERLTAGARGSDYYYVARMNAQFLVLSHGTDILGGPDLATVIRALCKMRLDQAWLSSWKDPKEIAHAIDSEIRAASLKMHRCKGCNRRSKEEKASLAAEVKTALRAPIPESRRKTLPRRITKARRRRRTRLTVLD